MKILFYISAIITGGAERVISNLANELYDRGHTCVLVNTYQIEDKYKINPNIQRYYLDQSKKGNIIFRNISYVTKLRDICKKECADINISFLREPNIRLIIAANGLGQKTVVSVRNVPEKEYGNKILLCFVNKLFAKADGIIFQTNDAKKSFGKEVQIKGKVLLNPVNKLFYKFRSDLDFDSRKGIAAVARLSPQKNYALLLCAYAKIANKIKDNLIIYGKGPEENKLKDLAEKLGIGDRVDFVGVSGQLWEDIRNTKLFVLTSDYEGMPNALMEAMALGIPVVSTDCPCGGPRMILGNDNENGILVKCGDTNQFADAMEKILLDRKVWNTYHQKALSRSTVFFSENVFDEWEEYMQDIVKMQY